jgi:hypothetical protein
LVAGAQAAGVRLGKDRYRRLSSTAGEIQRLIRRVSPITIWRERAGLSQCELDMKAETSPSYVSKIEAGKKAGCAAVLLRLARALDVPMDFLVAEQP